MSELERAKKDLPDYIVDCASNFEKVLGKSVDDIITYLHRCPVMNHDSLKSWGISSADEISSSTVAGRLA